MASLSPRIPFGLLLDQIQSESMRLSKQADLVTIFIFQGRAKDGISKCLLLNRLLTTSSPSVPLKYVGWVHQLLRNLVSLVSKPLPCLHPPCFSHWKEGQRSDCIKCQCLIYNFLGEIGWPPVLLFPGCGIFRTKNRAVLGKLGSLVTLLRTTDMFTWHCLHFWQLFRFLIYLTWLSLGVKWG